jgi:hypothetical protein
MSDEKQEDKSYIYIEFNDIGSVEIKDFQLNQVTAFQLLAMAHLMEFEGKNTLSVERMAQMQQSMEQQKQILVPKPNVELGKVK